MYYQCCAENILDEVNLPENQTITWFGCSVTLLWMTYASKTRTTSPVLWLFTGIGRNQGTASAPTLGRVPVRFWRQRYSRLGHSVAQRGQVSCTCKCSRSATTFRCAFYSRCTCDKLLITIRLSMCSEPSSGFTSDRSSISRACHFWVFLYAFLLTIWLSMRLKSLPLNRVRTTLDGLW